MMEQWLNERDKSIVTHVLLGIAHVHTSCITGSQPSDLLLCSLSNCTPLAPRLLVASLAVWMQFHAKSAGHSSTSKKADLMRTVTDQCGTPKKLVQKSRTAPVITWKLCFFDLFWGYSIVLLFFYIASCMYGIVSNPSLPNCTKLVFLYVDLFWPWLIRTVAIGTSMDVHKSHSAVHTFWGAAGVLANVGEGFLKSIQQMHAERGKTSRCSSKHHKLS